MAVRRRRSAWIVCASACAPESIFLSVDALAQERGRIAADVHDLVMQDLAFALAAARTLADDPALAQRALAVVEASERALAGARGSG